MVLSSSWLKEKIEEESGIRKEGRQHYFSQGVIIAAGTVVTKDVAPLAIVGGNSTKMIKYRDETHYYQLKKQQKFH